MSSVLSECTQRKEDTRRQHQADQNVIRNLAGGEVLRDRISSDRESFGMAWIEG